MAVEYKTGKSGGFSLNSTPAYFTKWDMTLDKTWANATDSSGYDPTTKQLWKKMAAGAIGGSGSVEGYFDFDAGSSAFLTALLADDPVDVVFKYDETTTFATGQVTLKNFKTGVDVEGGTTIGFSCDFDTYGVMEVLPA